MVALAALFAFLAVAGIVLACVTGSGQALVFGLVDMVVALVAFCVWAWSL